MISRKYIGAARRNADSLMKKKNVVGVGAGMRRKKGKATDEKAIVVLVRKKEAKSRLKAEDLLPDTIEVDGKEVHVDVIEVGEIRALSPQHRFNHRPLVTGVSCGHFAITAGTLGLFVERDGKPYLLSNNHVLANTNAAQVGDAIYQPGPMDGGRSRHTVANLAAFVPISFTRQNKVDAALALMVGTEAPTEPSEPPVVKKEGLLKRWWDAIVAFFRRLFGDRVSRQSTNVVVDGKVIEGSGPAPTTQVVEFSNTVLNLPGTITYELADVWEEQTVQKSGRTTGYTTGTVLAIGATVDVEFDPGQVARFSDQIIADNFSDGGDSGSAVFDMEGNAVGLLFAGSHLVTILNPMKTVFKELGITRIWRS